MPCTLVVTRRRDPRRARLTRAAPIPGPTACARRSTTRRTARQRPRKFCSASRVRMHTIRARDATARPRHACRTNASPVRRCARTHRPSEKTFASSGRNGPNFVTRRGLTASSLEQIGRRSRHLVPRREHDSEAVTTGNAPLLVVVFVVVGVVVPPSTVRLEDRAPALEAEVEAVRTTVPRQRILTHEVGEPVRDEQPARLHLERRPRRMNRVEIRKQLAHRSDAGAAASAETARGRPATQEQYVEARSNDRIEAAAQRPVLQGKKW